MKTRHNSSTNISSFDLTWEHSRLNSVPIVNLSRLLTSSQVVTFITTKVTREEILTKYHTLTSNAVWATTVKILSASSLIIRFSSYIIPQDTRLSTVKASCIKRPVSTTNTVRLLIPIKKLKSNSFIKCQKINISMISSIKLSGAPTPISKKLTTKTRPS